MEVRDIRNRYFSFDNKNHGWPQICTIILSSMTGFTACALFAWPSPSVPMLISNNTSDNLSLEEASYFTVIPPIGTLLACPIVAILMESIGRKKLILVLSIPQIIALILIAVSRNIFILYVSRFMSGISDAVLFGVVPPYIGEIATPRIRGTWGNLLAICIYLGQFLMNVIGTYCSIKTTALIFLVVPILHLVLFTFAPESPYYLIANNQSEKAKNSLKLLRWNENVEEELHRITKDVQRQISESSRLKDLFVIPTNRKALLLCIVIRSCQVFSGLPAFAVYTQYIFGLAGGNLSASTSAIIYTAALFLLSSISSFFVDKFGRRPLMIISYFGCTVALLIEATYFYLMVKTTTNLSNFNWIPLAGMILFVTACSTGVAILPTLMIGELFSASVKGKATSVVNVFFSIYVLLVPKLFQLLTSNFGIHVPFFVFFVCSFFSTLFAYFFVPETKRKTLEEIQQALVKKKLNKEEIETTKV